MRTPILFVVPMFLTLCGCAGSVIFGHVVGQSDSKSTDRAPVQAPAQAPAPAAAPIVVAAPAVAAVPAAAPAPDKSRVAIAPGGTKLKAVTIAFTEAARHQIDTDPAFNRDALLAAVRAALESRQLLEPMLAHDAEASSDRTVEILIAEFASRPSSNAVVLGYAFSNASLTGSIEVRDSTGQVLRTFDIEAEHRFATRTDAGKAPTLDALYQRFAEVTVSRLTGVPISAPDETSKQMPR